MTTISRAEDAAPEGREGGEAPTEVTHSLIIPVYRNAENVAELVEALGELAARIGPTFEVVLVVDGSPDASGPMLLERQKDFPFRSKIAFHSRNFGSFTAIRTGLELASGRYFAVMAADLQEPPEVVLAFFDLLARDSADVVFGQRAERNDPFLRTLASNTFWALYRRLVVPDIPPGGVDVFACNRAVRDAVLDIAEPNSSLVAQLFWVGYRRAFVPYARRERRHGTSAWNFSRRLRYMMDSIFSFSDAPIMLVLWIGAFGCLLSLVLGVVTLVAKLAGLITVSGYTAIILLILFFGSSSLAVQGILGCYLWRAFENTKRRPLRLISRVVEKEGR